MRRALFACVLLIVAGFAGSPAAAQCRPGEVWGDVGCRPKPSPSILVKAARRLKRIRFRRKRSQAAPAPSPGQ
jgi:hypothetical protein